MKHTQIEVRRYPKMIEAFARENFNLKALAAGLILLMLANSAVLIFLLHRGPMVIPLQADGSIGRVDATATEAQVRAAAVEYLNHRYAWTDATITTELKKAEFFIAPQLVSAFEKAMTDTIKYVHEKKVTQRVYPRKIDVNFKERLISVSVDRITQFDALKAATEMNLVLNFELLDRTVVNPWGVFITRETEKALQ